MQFPDHDRNATHVSLLV